MNENPLLALSELGQSIWIDYVDRSRLKSGEVRHQIEEDGLRGMTSNPTIFEKAITGDRSYDDPVRDLAYRDHGRPALRLEEQLDKADAVLHELAAVGIDLDTVTQRLEREGVRKFCDSYDRLLAAIARRRDEAMAEQGRHSVV